MKIISDSLLIQHHERSFNQCLAVRNGKDTRSPRINAKKSCAKTAIKRNNTFAFFLIFSCFICLPLSSDSLWTPNFEGYLAEDNSLQAGEIVVVDIDAGFSLSFRATSSDSKSFTLEFSGGEYGNLLSFLPDTSSSGDRSVQGDEGFSLTTRFVTRVEEILPSNQVFLRGTRTISVGGKQESIEISGWVNKRDLGGDRQITFSQMADTQLIFRSFLDPGQNTLTAADLEEIFAEIPPAGTEGATGETQPQSMGFALTDERKQELFITFINRLIDILFR